MRQNLGHYWFRSYKAPIVFKRCRFTEQRRGSLLSSAEPHVVSSLIAAFLIHLHANRRCVLRIEKLRYNSRPQASSPMLALTQLCNYLTLKGSFSAVSKPNFASKYALESSRRDLQNAVLCTALQSQFFVEFL